MLLSAPRMLDLSLGAAFVLIDTAVFVCSYYMIINKEDDPHAWYSHFIFILYGYVQSLIGFVAGLWLARITQVEVVKPTITEEEMTLIEKT